MAICTCPRCSQRMNVRSEYMGLRVLCAYCRKEIPIEPDGAGLGEDGPVLLATEFMPVVKWRCNFCRNSGGAAHWFAGREARCPCGKVIAVPDGPIELIQQPVGGDSLPRSGLDRRTGGSEQLPPGVKKDRRTTRRREKDGP